MVKMVVYQCRDEECRTHFAVETDIANDTEVICSGCGGMEVVELGETDIEWGGEGRVKFEELPKRDGRRTKSGAVIEQSQCPCGRWVNTIHKIDDETYVCGNCASRIINKQLEEKR